MKLYYRYNVNHPAILMLYKRYKSKVGVPEHFPLSDEQRADFEGYMDMLLAHGKLPKDVLALLADMTPNRTKEKDL